MPEDLPSTGAPQVRQKPLLAVFPLSAGWAKYLTSPVIVRASCGTAKAETCPEPLAFWHYRQ